MGDQPANELRYDQCGCLVLESEENNHLLHTRSVLEAGGVPFENLSATDLERWLPGADLRRFGPPKRITDSAFGESDGSRISGGVFCPSGGYVADPQLACRHLVNAVESLGKLCTGSCASGI